MNTPDLSQEQQEIIRLNKIISVLLEQIDSLKLNYSRLQEQMTTNQVFDGISGQPTGINKMVDSHLQQPTGINKMVDAHLQQPTGTNKMIDSHLLHPTGMNKMIDSHRTQGMPVNNVIDANMQQGMPVNKEIYPHGQQGLPVDQPVYQLPPTLMVSGENINLLCRKLGESILKRSRDSARENAADLLIHFYNKGSGKYEDLEKVTGYSKGGLAKLMILMRNKGLITRSAFQQFSPSQKALQLMQEAKLK